MIDERTLELIHAELDAEIDAGDLAELQRRLASDPEASAMREHLAKVAGALGRMPPVMPPAGLQQQILQATRPTAKVVPFPDRRVRFVRYTMALAAGTIIAAVGIGFTGASRVGFDSGQLVGTMGRPAAEPVSTGAEIKLQAPDLKGSVALSPVDGRLLLLFNLASEQPVKVTAAYAEAAFRLQQQAPSDSGVGAYRATPGHIEFVNQGTQRLALMLDPEAGGPVRISFEGQGRVLQEAVLDVPAQPSEK